MNGTHRLSNYLKTAVLLAGLTALALAVGNQLGGARGMLIAGVFVAVMNFGAYWFSDRIALAAHGAKPVTRAEAPWLYDMVSSLANRAGLPMPKLYIIPSPSPNAFATGRNPEHAAVAVTAGIVDILDQRELRGVLAHELAHVKNRDTLISTVAATLAGVITQAAQMLFFFGGSFLRNRDDEDSDSSVFAQLGLLLVAPIAATLLQLAISRSREYGADATGAQIAGDPISLANALRKLERGVQMVPNNHAPATAHLFIVNPLSGGGIFSLFATHPPMAERIRRLEEMSLAGHGVPAVM